MTTTPYQHDLDVALEAVNEAGIAIMEEYARFLAIANAPADISTVADRLSQNIILDHLHAAFPADALCAEETTDLLSEVSQTGPRVWIVDPRFDNVEVYHGTPFGLALKRVLSGRELLTESLLPGFEMPLHELFAGSATGEPGRYDF